jgi:hypothetical protein
MTQPTEKRAVPPLHYAPPAPPAVPPYPKVRAALLVSGGVVLTAVGSFAAGGLATADLRLGGVFLIALGLLSGLRPRRIADPTFGTLEYRRGVWHGDFAPATSVGLRVFAGDGGPTGHHRELFDEMKRRSDELAAAVEPRLAEEYRRCRDAARAEYERAGGELLRTFDSDFPPVAQSSDIWAVARLGCVEVRGDDEVDLCLVYEMDWADPDHSISVLVKGWKVIDVGEEG